MPDTRRKKGTVQTAQTLSLGLWPADTLETLTDCMETAAKAANRSGAGHTILQPPYATLIDFARLGWQHTAPLPAWRKREASVWLPELRRILNSSDWTTRTAHLITTGLIQAGAGKGETGAILSLFREPDDTLRTSLKDALREMRMQHPDYAPQIDAIMPNSSSVKPATASPATAHTAPFPQPANEASTQPRRHSPFRLQSRVKPV